MTPHQSSLPGVVAPLAQTEREYQSDVLALMAMLGWRCVHHRPLMTKRGGWQTGLQGAGSQGWPDIIAAKSGRLIAVELKSAKGSLTSDQRIWLRLLAECGIETHVWVVGKHTLQEIADVLTHPVGGVQSVG